MTYDAANRISSITYPDGLTSKYQYNSSGNLSQVTYQDGSVRYYHYENTSFPHALTGITDENGIRYATWSYDAQGHANLSKHAGNIEQVNLTYNGDGTTDAKDSFNTVKHFTFQNELNVRKVIGINQTTTDGLSIARSQSYDANGNIASRTDFNGNLGCYAYDLSRNLETVRVEGLASGSSCPADLAAYTPSGDERKTATQWHADYRLPIRIDEAGRRTDFDYDTNGNLLTKTVTDTATGQSRSWTYTYNNLGQVLSADGPRTDVNDVTTYVYYADSAADHKPGDLHTVTNALGHVTTFTAYDANGRLLSLTDPNGLVVGFAYDARGRLTHKTVDGHTTQYDYDPVGNLIKVTRPSGVFYSFTYDAAHRLTDIGDALSGKIHYTLDAMGNRIQEDILDANGTVVKTQSRMYDALNRLAQDIGAYNQIIRYQYDANANLTQVTDANGRSTQHQYDTLDRLIRSTDALNGQTDYFYDAQGRLTQVADPRGLTTDRQIDGLGNLTQLDSPDTGFQSHQHDATGNLITTADAAGVITRYSYDSTNRPTQIQHTKAGSTSESVMLEYDQGTNGLGHLTGLRPNYSGGLSSWRYDLDGRLISQQHTTGQLTFSLQLQYDEDGRVANMLYPSGHIVTFHYDTAGQVNRLDVDGVPSITDITWSLFGGAQGWTWTESGSRYARDYDLSGRVTAVTLGNNTRNLEWDANGWVSQSSDETIAVPGTLTNQLSFGYDELGRLNRYQSLASRHDYGYDPDGNRISKTVDGATVDYTYDIGSNRLSATSAQSYQYDAVGRVINDGTNQYHYNNAGRLAEIVNSQGRTWYYYNGLGQRVGKWLSRPSDLAGDADHDGKITVLDARKIVIITQGSHPIDPAGDCNRDNAVTLADVYCVIAKRGLVDTDKHAFTHFVYDPAGHLIGEYRQIGEPIQETVYLGDTPVLILMPNAGTPDIYTIDTDHLDTPRVIKNKTGTVVWRWDRAEPFGATSPDTDPSGLGTFTYHLRFPGQYYDAETGLHYNQARYYQPSLGRYLQSDPIGLAGGINTYTYALNNPLRYTDPQGLVVPAILAACAANPACDAAVATAVSATASAIGRAAIIAGVSSLVTSDSRYRNPQKVVRGGMCTVDSFANGSGVKIDSVTGLLSGVSVNTFPNTSVEELSRGLRNGQIGVTTVGDIEDAGGQVIPDPTRNNPYHAEMLGVTPEVANQLFTPTIPNPSK